MMKKRDDSNDENRRETIQMMKKRDGTMKECRKQKMENIEIPK